MAKTKQTTEAPATPAGEVWVQLATRVPKVLHKALKMYCAASDDESIMDFVIHAIEERLAAQTKSKSKARK